MKWKYEEKIILVFCQLRGLDEAIEGWIVVNQNISNFECCKRYLLRFLPPVAFV